ncbi:MAG: polysaccharide biosynthesis tyrosine autokinase [Candidatus Omnitrophica bacterium]|nr:polysaccharide biosynthesis tyrosine autokinase [Candidatus Omnitrophota bacterium]
MGKISDALRKVQEQREQERGLARKAAVDVIPVKTEQPQKSKDFVAIKDKPKGEDPVLRQPAKPRSKLQKGKEKLLTLEEKLRIREQLSVAKVKDSSGVDPRVVVHHDYSSPVSEQYRILRTNLKSQLKKMSNGAKLSMNRLVSPTKFITVTSALHNEGKSVTSANLAVALAKEIDSKVLLVDCDMRKGTVHKLFNVNGEYGLSDILENDFDYSVGLQNTAVENLFVIPAGHVPENPSELIGSRKMRTFIERLRAEPYTYVIFDTPPVIHFTDVGLLGYQTDGVLMVVQSYRTHAPIVQKARDFLAHSHSRFLGFVLTQIENYNPILYGYYYNYYHRRNEEQVAATA